MPPTRRQVVAAGTRLTDEETRGRLRDQIARLAAELLDGAPEDVLLAAPGSLPKTSSGKIPRAAGGRSRHQPQWPQTELH